MAQMTKSTLLHLNTEGGEKFRAGRLAAHNALAGFEHPVWARIKNGVIWSGEGQPDAERVAQNQVLALHVSEAMMEAAAATMDAVAQGTNYLRDNMKALNDYAKSLGLWVEEDGTADWDDNNPNKPHSPSMFDNNKRFNVTHAVQQTLRAATVLDLSTKASLQTIYEHAPEVVDNATDAAKALQKNKQLFVDALEQRTLIVQVSAAWATIGGPGYGNLLNVGDLKATRGQLLPAKVGEVNDHLLELIESGIGLTKAGPLLNALKRDIPLLLVDAVVIKADAAAKAAADAGKKTAAELLKIPVKIYGAYQWGEFIKAAAAFLISKLAPDSEPTTWPVVDLNRNVRAHVSDEGLSHVAADYYNIHGFGGGGHEAATIADLARAQRLGVIEPGAVDYVEEATRVRDNLQDWLNETKNLPDDSAYAQGLVDELNGALDPTPEREKH